MRSRQLSFLPKVRPDHGGDIGRGKRKIMRPFDPKRPVHVVLRSEVAKGSWSMLHPDHVRGVEEVIGRAATRYRIRIYRLANVGNHLHLLLRARRRADFQAFLRVITGAIAFLITGTRKGRKLARPFWEKLAYSRLATWGREYKALQAYLVKNLFEAANLWEPGLRIVMLSLREAGIGPP